MEKIEIPKTVSIGNTIIYFRNDRFFSKRYRKQLYKLEYDYQLTWEEKQQIAHNIIKDYFQFMDDAVK